MPPELKLDPSPCDGNTHDVLTVSIKHLVTCTEVPRDLCPGSHDLFSPELCQWGIGNLKEKKKKKNPQK